MKSVTLFLIYLSLAHGFATNDTNVLFLGDWSQPVSDATGYAIRGRLLIEQKSQYRGGLPFDIAVYLELQEHSRFLGGPVEISCDFDHDFRCQLFEPSGVAVSSHPGFRFNGPHGPSQFKVTLPTDASIRLRVSPPVGCWQEDGGLELSVYPWQTWWIDSKDTNEYFLSGTFTVAPTNNVRYANPDVWAGTLTLPKVKISLRQP
jgi:hypothetical protein